MTWKTGTIKLEAARAIFTGIEFEEVMIGDAPAGYRAMWGTNKCTEMLEDRSLTRLCQRLWEKSNTRN